MKEMVPFYAHELLKLLKLKLIIKTSKEVGETPSFVLIWSCMSLLNLDESYSGSNLVFWPMDLSFSFLYFFICNVYLKQLCFWSFKVGRKVPLGLWRVGFKSVRARLC